MIKNFLQVLFLFFPALFIFFLQKFIFPPVFAQEPTVSLTISNPNPLPNETISIVVNTNNGDAHSAGLYFISLDYASDPEKVCSWPGGWQTITHQTPIGQTVWWKAPLLGKYYVVVNLKDKNNAPLCAGAFSWDDKQNCNFSYPKCKNGYALVEVRIKPFWGDDTHPNFWPAGNYQYTAKKYIKDPRSFNSPAEVVWVWSGPWGNNQRHVIYQEYFQNQPGSYREWEKWERDSQNHLAILHSYGGKDEASSISVYLNNLNCTREQTGHPWPNLINHYLAFSPETRWDKEGNCISPWINENQPGGYIAVYLKDWWDQPQSETRKQKCDEYIPSNLSQSANQICKLSPNVGIIYQRYAIKTSTTSPQYLYGCEATVYAWGYSYKIINNFRYWFRNGELRWSDWLNLGETPEVHPPQDNEWWDSQCQRAWQEKTNWLYSGDYKLTNSEFTDPGDNLPGDVDLNGEINGKDAKIIFSLYRASSWPSNLAPDQDKDNHVTLLDFGYVFRNWGI